MGKVRTCKFCKKKNSFEDSYFAGMNAFCDVEHAIQWAIENKDKGKKIRQKEARKQRTVKKKSIRSRSEWYVMIKREKQKLARMRDKDEPCCTCGAVTAGQWDGGHYITAKRADPRMLILKNIHKQCSVCNQYNGGKPIEYREFMVDKYGAKYVDWLEEEKNHKPLKEQFPTWQDLEAELARTRAEVRKLSE